MVKVGMGEKRRCLSCCTPFFDLNRTPIVCPKCAAVFQIVHIVRSSNTRMRPPAYKEAELADPVQADAVLVVDEKDDVDSDIPPADQDDEMDEAEAAI
jgi:uncharacterized protein (TIGR02300 family)